MPDLPEASDDCDCPYCSDENLDPRQLVSDLTSGAGDLIGCEDPLDVELAGAVFLSIGAVAGEEFADVLAEGMIPAFEAEATAEALTLLLAVGSVAEGASGEAAQAAAGRLVAAGVTSPGWVDELAEPVTVADCWRLAGDQGLASVLACSFHRAGRSHAFVMSVDHVECGAASDIQLFDADQLPEVMEAMRASGRDNGVEVVEEKLDPAEFRWHVEGALNARAVHDLDAGVPETEDMPDDDAPGYSALAVLLRARMSTLPAPDRPAAGHDEHLLPGGLAAARELLEQLAAQGGGPFSAPAPKAELSAKRKKSAGPAPIYQVKVGLRDAKPPIWRRLEVPADISLARLRPRRLRRRRGYRVVDDVPLTG